LIITFDLPGKPHGKGRPRATSTGRMYTPQATRDAEGFIRHQAAQAMTGQEVLRGAVQGWVEIEVEPPVSFSKKKRAAALAGEVFPTIAPDVDNIAKAIFDACNGVVYVDDKQVVQLSMMKRYGERDVTTVSFANMEPSV
jgi:Holliday junction resolvase RusA-like endonuclease